MSANRIWVVTCFINSAVFADCTKYFLIYLLLKPPFKRFKLAHYSTPLAMGFTDWVLVPEMRNSKKCFKPLQANLESFGPLDYFPSVQRGQANEDFEFYISHYIGSGNKMFNLVLPNPPVSIFCAAGGVFPP